MKICVFGAGAIGGYLAVELALAGHEVSAVARGAHLDAIRKDGLKLRIEGQEKVVRITASDDPATLGPQDYVICAVKTHQAYESAALMLPLLVKFAGLMVKVCPTVLETMLPALMRVDV